MTTIYTHRLCLRSYWIPGQELDPKTLQPKAGSDITIYYVMFCEVWWLEFPTICPCLKRAAYIDMPSPGRPRRDRAYSQVCRTPGGWDYSCGNVGGYQQ